jgi:hypothetical protein
MNCQGRNPAPTCHPPACMVSLDPPKNRKLGIRSRFSRKKEKTKEEEEKIDEI